MRRLSISFIVALGTLIPMGSLLSQPARADQVSLQLGVSNPTMLAGEKETNFVRIALTGFDLAASKDRPSVNVAIVIDTSGSMSGQKIDQARKAAIAAVNRLKNRDIVSVVLYNSSAQVLVPATKATDRASIIRKIESVTAGGSTALFAGVSKGASEVRKFLDSESVNRVILLSDGMANIGPKSPRELERLGASLVKEGISVSTLGLGLSYNEDLMSGLAAAGSGNHIFVEEADDLIAVFNSEFNDLMSVVAGDFRIEATLAAGVRPVRVLGTKADISQQTVRIPLTQLYARQQRYFVLEVEVDKGEAGTTRPLLSVSVQYQNMVSETTDKLSSSVDVRFSDSLATVQDERDPETYAFCAVQIANERNIKATALRDAGQIDEAKKLLDLNQVELRKSIRFCEDKNVTNLIPELNRNVDLNKVQSAYFDDSANWARNRKMMRGEQLFNQSQQTYKSPQPKGGR